MTMTKISESTELTEFATDSMAVYAELCKELGMNVSTYLVRVVECEVDKPDNVVSWRGGLATKDVARQWLEGLVADYRRGH